MSESRPPSSKSSSGAQQPVSASPAKTPVPPASKPAVKPSIVRIVGTGNGIVMLIGDRGGRWSDIVRILSEHLAKAEGFFQGERIAIEIGERGLSAEDMQQIADVLTSYKMTIWAVRTSNPETHRMVQEIGLAAEWMEKGNGALTVPTQTKSGRAQWEVHLGQKGQATPSPKPVDAFHPPKDVADSIVGQVLDSADAPRQRSDESKADAKLPTQIAPIIAEQDEVESDEDAAERELILAPPYVYRGTLRSGQVFRHAGTVMVVGDVNPGAEVISGGDIFVWGKLRGIVHAGAMGNERSVVCAIDFEPIQLRIAGYIAMSPRTATNEPGRWFWKRESVEKPEVARVMGKQIVVDNWDSQ